MDVKYSREVAVGTIVLIAIGIFIFGTMWLSGRSLSPGDDYLQIRFANAAGLKEGSPVRVSGVPVGRIERIQLLEPGDVRAWISVPERIVPMSDASAEIVPVGLVGDYAIDFTPGASTTPLDRETVIQGGRETALTEMAEVLGSRADTVLLGMQAFTSAEMAENFRLTLTSMQQTLDGLSRSLPSTTRQANETMASLQRIIWL